jgi:hypothetical protein
LGGPRYSQEEQNFNQDEIHDPMLTAMEFLAPLSWTIYKENKKIKKLESNPESR